MHGLFGERFVSAREPGWHQLGHAHQGEVTAREAYEKAGPFQVELFPEHIDLPNGARYMLSQNAIMRSPVQDDPTWRHFGSVSKDYTLITPEMFVDIWDGSVGRPVETYGALHNGSTMFLSTYLPDLNVKGDLVNNYLLAVSPMTGNEAAEVRVTPVRVVCQNTLSLARGISTESFRIIHDQTAADRMGLWLTGIYQRALDKMETLQEAFDILAGKQVNTVEVKYVLDRTYPLREMKRFDAPEDQLEIREMRILAKNRRAMSYREAAQDLFEGNGTGLKDPNIIGTGWALYNAITETEDYRKGRSDTAISEDAVFGRRAQAKERGFTATLDVAKGTVDLDLWSTINPN